MPLDDTGRREVERIALRAATEVMRRAPQSGLLVSPTIVGAYVSAPALAGGPTTIKIDGDVNPVSGVQNATGAALVTGQRVLVLLRPTGGAMIMGLSGAAPGTPQPIARLYVDDGTLTSFSVTVELPQHYRDLAIRIRSNPTTSGNNLGIQVNGVTTVSYVTEVIYAAVGGVPTTYYAALDYMRVGFVDGGASATEYGTIVHCLAIGYTNATRPNSLLSHALNARTGVSFGTETGGHSLTTAGAWTTMRILNTSGDNFAAGSYIEIDGIV